MPPSLSCELRSGGRLGGQVFLRRCPPPRQVAGGRAGIAKGQAILLACDRGSSFRQHFRRAKIFPSGQLRSEVGSAERRSGVCIAELRRDGEDPVDEGYGIGITALLRAPIERRQERRHLHRLQCRRLETRQSAFAEFPGKVYRRQRTGGGDRQEMVGGGSDAQSLQAGQVLLIEQDGIGIFCGVLAVEFHEFGVDLQRSEYCPRRHLARRELGRKPDLAALVAPQSC